MTTLKSRNVGAPDGSWFYEIVQRLSRQRDVGSKDLNHSQIQGNENIRQCMLERINFENAYAAVMESRNYSDKDERLSLRP